jgi:hypothetical protein
MSKASLGEEPVAQHNFACQKTSAFAPDYTKPIRNSRLQVFGIASQIFAHPGSGSKTVKVVAV